MLYYLIRVPNDEETPISQDVMSFRLESFNNEENYLLFDGGDQKEMRYILVSEDDYEESEKIPARLKSVFKKGIVVEAIGMEDIDQKILNKIRVAKELMSGGDNYRGNLTPMFYTGDYDQVIEEADTTIGSGRFKAFLVDFMDYIDRTADISVNAMYNVVLINNHDVTLKPHIDLLYRVLAIKGLLIEYAIIKGDKSDLRYTNRETRSVFVIEDDWSFSDGDEYYRPTAEDKLLNAIFGDVGCSAASHRSELLAKIKDSVNIYITSMKQEEYDRLSEIDLFAVAFPNATNIDELTVEDKVKSISQITGEYRFAIDEDGFADSQLVKTTSMEDIEIAVRKAIQRKLISNDHAFLLEISDITINEDSSEKVSAFDELESLIGLGGVKKTIKEIVALLEKRGKNAVPCLHMAFLGNPGTGKTTVARIIAKLFAEVGLTKKDLLVETQRGGLVGKYLGHTAQKTATVIKSAFGGVLFIDEAYSLIERDDDTYGKEAIATLVKIMEDKRDEFVCILAGYTADMNAMLDVNPGLRDRIQFHIEFPDYSVSELMQIFEMLCMDNKYELSNDARAALEVGLKRIQDAKSLNFSNGRLVRKIFERVRIKQALRTSDDIIVEVDISEALAERDIAALFGNNRKAIGFLLSA